MWEVYEAYSVIECTPLGVDDHFASKCCSGVTSKLGNFGYFFHVRSVCPGTKDGSYSIISTATIMQ